MRLQANACVRLQLLLGQRPNETAAMRWLDVDAFVGHGRWMNPSSVRKDRKVNVVPLGPLATRILEDLRPLTGLGERVFRDLSLRNEVRWWRPILGHAMTEGAAHFTRLDLRRTCATGCAAAGAQPYTVSRILGHAIPHGQVAITMIYDRFSRLPETAAALNAWAAHVGGLVTCSACGGAMRNEGRTLRCSACGREREQPRADVVPIARV
jgi:integrase